MTLGGRCRVASLNTCKQITDANKASTEFADNVIAMAFAHADMRVAA